MAIHKTDLLLLPLLRQPKKQQQQQPPPPAAVPVLSLLDRATNVVIDKVGSTTTLLVKRLQEAGIVPAPHEATLFCLGIRADTGGLLYEGTTVRDATALLWCLQNGASQEAISEFGVARIVGETQRAILQQALVSTQTTIVRAY
jgi:nanoRNase/pAp phosphatase (c-di-AMP/oligoRNAs hydrolase)